eukprot:scaffold5189_cov165-Chaetoceros_neogracile.AAC.2
MTSVGIDDADMERERYFDLAIQTEGRMSHLESVVEDLEKNLKDLQSDHLEGGDLGKVVQVMSRQHDMLSAFAQPLSTIKRRSTIGTFKTDGLKPLLIDNNEKKTKTEDSERLTFLTNEFEAVINKGDR